MSRTLSTNLNTQTALRVTTPVYLVYIGFSPSPLRVSSRGPATALSASWVQAGVRIQRVTPFEAAVIVRNDDLSASALALGGAIENVAMRVYQSYGNGPSYATGDIITLFDGVLDAVPSITDDEVVFSGKAHSELLSKMPRYRVNELTFTKLPPTGTVIVWGGDKITLERAQ